MGIEHIAQERHHAVDRDEQEDSNDVLLLVGFEVVCRVRKDEEEADTRRDQRKYSSEKEAKVVESEALPQRFLVDDLILHCAIADGHGCRLRRGAVKV